MPLKPLEVLKKGLKTLCDQVKAKKSQLWTQLAEGNSISSQEEKWLDAEADLVKEARLVDILENASDYERGIERLDDGQKGLLTKLRQAAGDLSKVVGKKRKRVCVFSCRFSLPGNN
jgi:hypothetical protein